MKLTHLFLCMALFTAGFATSPMAQTADDTDTELFYAGLNMGCLNAFDRNPSGSSIPQPVRNQICTCMVDTFKANKVTGAEPADTLKSFSEKVTLYCAQTAVASLQKGTPEE